MASVIYLVTPPPANMTVAPPSGFIHGPADVAKLVSGLLLFLIVLIATFLPAICVRRARGGHGPEVEEDDETNFIPSLPGPSQRRRRLILKLISCFNCFSGGVFLATGILDVFTDASADVLVGLKAYNIKLEFPLASFSLLVGFFVLLIIEQIVACHTSRRENRHSHQYPVQDESLAWNSEISQDDLARPRRTASFTASLDGIRAPVSPRVPSPSPRRLRGLSQSVSEEEQHDHLVEVMTREGSPIRALFLVGAISVHSLFEGLALGLETSPHQIYQLCGAISLHKTILACGIGLSLGQSHSVRRGLIIASSVIFAAMSPIGLFIGMGLTYAAHANTDIHGGAAQRFKLVSGILQGMACGTFLYVTFFEILPREINEDTKPARRTLYMVSLLAGFLGMSLFVYFL